MIQSRTDQRSSRRSREEAPRTATPHTARDGQIRVRTVRAVNGAGQDARPAGPYSGGRSRAASRRQRSRARWSADAPWAPAATGVGRRRAGSRSAAVVRNSNVNARSRTFGENRYVVSSTLTVPMTIKLRGKGNRPAPSTATHSPSAPRKHGQDRPSRLDTREKVREVALNVSEVHLVEHEQVRLSRALQRPGARTPARPGRPTPPCPGRTEAHLGSRRDTPGRSSRDAPERPATVADPGNRCLPTRRTASQAGSFRSRIVR